MDVHRWVVPGGLNDAMCQIYSKFHKHHCAVVHLEINNTWFFIPHKRGRAWFFYVSLKNTGLQLKDAMSRLERMKGNVLALKAAVEGKRLPASAFLLPATHALVEHERWRLRSRWTQKLRKAESDASARAVTVPDVSPDDPVDDAAEPVAKKLKKNTQSWVESAKEAWSTADVPWVDLAVGASANFHVGVAGIEPLREQSNIFYATLPTREKVNLYFLEKTLPQLAVGEQRCLEIGRSATRTLKAKSAPGIFPCVLPKMKVWLQPQDRWMLGEEKMTVQGFFGGSYKAGSATTSVMGDLAGNAVGVPVCDAVNWFLDIL